jgi:hypothetical protein
MTNNMLALSRKANNVQLSTSDKFSPIDFLFKKTTPEPKGSSYHSFLCRKENLV